jgi:hypothetical protein
MIRSPPPHGLKNILCVFGIVILALGLTAAAVVYATAGNESGNATGYEIVNGVVYPIASEDTKLYRHDLERYGGKMAVITDEFGNWFARLWHGKSLAYTIAVVSVVLAAAVFLVAYWAADRDETR